jgi:hypothetical protein
VIKPASDKWERRYFPLEQEVPLRSFPEHIGSITKAPRLFRRVFLRSG